LPTIANTIQINITSNEAPITINANVMTVAHIYTVPFNAEQQSHSFCRCPKCAAAQHRAPPPSVRQGWTSTSFRCARLARRDLGTAPWLSRAPAMDAKSVHYLQHLDHLAALPSRCGARSVYSICETQCFWCFAAPARCSADAPRRSRFDGMLILSGSCALASTPCAF
jgi:hypothetical protein